MKKVLIVVFISVIITACNEKDNYPAPDNAIQGAVIDQETGDSIPSQQLNGLRVRLYDLQYESPQPIDFWGKQNGSFKNAKLFTGQYKMIVDNGAFYPLDTTTLEIPMEKDIEVKALPYLRIQASVQTGENHSVIVHSKLSKTKPEESSIVKRAVFINETPYVDFNNFVNDNPITNTEDVADEELTGTTLKDTLTELESGKTYFIRVAALADNASENTYNYSKVYKVTP